MKISIHNPKGRDDVELEKDSFALRVWNSSDAVREGVKVQLEIDQDLYEKLLDELDMPKKQGIGIKGGAIV